MKRGLLLAAGTIVLLSSLMIVDSGEKAQAQTKPIELRFAHFLPPVSARQKLLFEPWVKMIEERTNGRVKITIYPAGSLLKQAQSIDGVLNNVAQISFADIEQSWGRFPLTEVVSLPMTPWARNERTGNYLVYQLFEKGLISSEFKDMKVLGLITAPPMVLSSSKKPIRTVSDMKGLKIATGQKGLADAVQLMGASPSNVLASDTYLALQRGTVDATMFSWVGMAIFKLQEVTKYHNDSGWAVGPLATVMNRQTWDSLPADIQKTIEGVSGEWYSKWDADVDTGVSERLVQSIKAMPGHEIIEFSPEEEAKAREISHQVWDKWVKEMEGKGLPGKKVLDAALQIMKEYKNWTLK
jgi:TRAP-type C4-dicarboxylate transport system substrate-binding protein